MSDRTPTTPALGLRPRDAAKALGISERTLWTWTKSGEIPCVKIGRIVMYPVLELQACLSRKAGEQALESGSDSRRDP